MQRNHFHELIMAPLITESNAISSVCALNEVCWRRVKNSNTIVAQIDLYRYCELYTFKFSFMWLPENCKNTVHILFLVTLACMLLRQSLFECEQN